MKKNKKVINEEIIDDSLENIFSDRFSRYSKYIIQDRALPDVRDGLKPVQRRILYAMHYDGNTYEKAYRKSAKSVGLIIGNFHPHGDSSVYDAMVRMSQWWKNNEPLIDMHGNNGSIDDDSAAAMRYTEARLSKFSSLLLKDIDYDTISWAPNFDDTLLEPTVLPSEIPLLLVNGALGIATGYATDIPPHNLGEVIDATIHRIQYPDCKLEDIFKYIKGPDFPTGGIIQGKNQLLNAYRKGKGKIVVRSKCEIVEKSNMSQIIITEIPYDVVKVKLVKEIDDRRFDKKVEGISDVRDESGRNGLRIVIDIKKEYDPNLILKYLYANTKLQINYNFNVVAIANQRPELMSLLMMLDYFIEHKEDVVLRRSKFLMNKKKDKCHILDGLIKAVSIMDDVIELIRRSKDKVDAKNRLIEAFLFTEQQAEAIVTLRLYRLTNTDIKALKEEYNTLTKEIFELKQIIENKAILTSTIINELKTVKKEFNQPRKTIIEEEIEDVKIDKVEMMVSERVMISVSKDGYLKKTSLRSFNSTEGIGGIKEGDSLIGYLECDSLDTLLIFTSSGNYAYIPVYELGEVKWRDIGKHLSLHVKLEANEKIVDVVVVKNFDTFAYILLATKNGMIKKSAIKDFSVTRYNKTYTAIKFKTDDELMSAKLCYQDDEVMVISDNAYCNYYSTELINPSGLKSSGIKSINLDDNDNVSSIVLIDDKQSSLLLMNDKGSSKRIHISDLINTNRPVKGYRLSKYIKTNPQYVKYACVCKISDAIIVYDQGVIDFDIKNIPFMDINSSYSSANQLDADYWLMIGIQEAKIIDYPIDYDNKEIKQIGLFDDEN